MWKDIYFQSSLARRTTVLNTHDWWRILCSFTSSSFKISGEKTRPKNQKLTDGCESFWKKNLYLYLYFDIAYRWYICLAPSCLPFSTQREELHCTALICEGLKGTFDFEMHGERVPLFDWGKPGHCTKRVRTRRPPQPLHNRKTGSQAQYKLA